MNTSSGMGAGLHRLLPPSLVMNAWVKQRKNPLSTQGLTAK